MAGRDLNKYFATGYLGAAPQSRMTKRAGLIAEFRIANHTGRWGANPHGGEEEAVNWFPVVAWMPLAAICMKDTRLRKGTKVWIEGQLRNRSWYDRDGRQRTVSEIDLLQYIVLREPPHPATVPVSTPPTPPPSAEDSHASLTVPVYRGMPDASLPPELGAFQMQGWSMEIPFTDTTAEDDDATA